MKSREPLLDSFFSRHGMFKETGSETKSLAAPTEKKISEPLPEKSLNFKGQKLSRFNFSKRDLAGADFSGADLSYASFKNTNLRGANFTGANLTGTYFAGECETVSGVHANCSGANFTDANLKGAIFSTINLDKAIFTRADLTQAYLGNIPCSETDWFGADLRHAQFLSTDDQSKIINNFRTKKDLKESKHACQPLLDYLLARPLSYAQYERKPHDHFCLFGRGRFSDKKEVFPQVTIANKTSLIDAPYDFKWENTGECSDFQKHILTFWLMGAKTKEELLSRVTAELESGKKYGAEFIKVLENVRDTLSSQSRPAL